MKPYRITAPASEPVTLAEFKQYARFDYADDDTTLQAILSASVAFLDAYDGYFGRAIINQEWRQPFSYWHPVLRLPMPDVSAQSIKYLDQDGVEQTLSASLYELVDDPVGPLICFKNDFSSPLLYDDAAQPVWVDFTCGYGPTAGDIPDTVKVAVMALAAHWERHREEMSGHMDSALPIGVKALLAPHRFQRG